MVFLAAFSMLFLEGLVMAFLVVFLSGSGVGDVGVVLFISVISAKVSSKAKLSLVSLLAETSKDSSKIILRLVLCFASITT